MILRLLKRLLTRDERLNYIGREFTFITDGGWEVTGKVVEYTDSQILIDSGGRVIRLERSKVVGESANPPANSVPQPLVEPEKERYDIREREAAPMPVALAKSGKAAPKTALEERLELANMESQELREDLGVTETLADERQAAREVERKSYGSIIPGDMLLPEEDSDEEEDDLAATFGVDFRGDIRGLIPRED